MKRRYFFTSLAAPLSSTVFLPALRAMADNSRLRIKITDVKVMMVREPIFTYPMVKIETDDGISGIGEGYWGGGVADIMRSHLKRSIMGENPLDIERLYTKMIKDTSGAGSIGGATITAISGVEIALWDLAGKILQVDVCQLLECKKIGDLASLFNIPMCGHGVSSPLGLIASAHCEASIRDFIAHEARIDWESKGWDKFMIYDRPIFKVGRIQLSDKPGFGVGLN